MKRSLMMLLFLCITLAGTTGASAETPTVYTVQKGDTLWDISTRFIKDPYYWPTLWSNNPEIPNPHLIYPGQKLYIYKNRISLKPIEPESAVQEPVIEEPTITSTAEEPVIVEEPAKPVRTIRVPGGREGFVIAEGLESMGLIIDAIDNRIMLGSGDTAFVKPGRGETVVPGDVYNIYRTDVPITHPITGLPAGHRVIELGQLEIVELNRDVVTARILDAYQEIRRGDRLLPFKERSKEIVVTDLERNVDGYIIDAKNGQLSLGMNDIIYIDRGEKDGMFPGTTLYISRSRKATDLAIGRDIELPDIRLGVAVVIKTYETTATAIITNSGETIQHGDRVSTTFH